MTKPVAKSVTRLIAHGRRECPDDVAQTDLDQWLTDGGRDVPDSDLNSPVATESNLPDSPL